MSTQSKQRLSPFRTKVLAAVDREMTPLQVAHKVGSTRQKAGNALWHLSKNGLIERSFYGVYAPIEVVDV